MFGSDSEVRDDSSEYLDTPSNDGSPGRGIHSEDVFGPAVPPYSLCVHSAEFSRCGQASFGEGAALADFLLAERSGGSGSRDGLDPSHSEVRVCLRGAVDHPH